MNVAKLVAALFEQITTVSGRSLSATILGIKPEAFFPVEPPESAHAKLADASERIAGNLADGDGEVTALELAQAVHVYHQRSGTTWCPPIEDALRAAAREAGEFEPTDEVASTDEAQ